MLVEDPIEAPGRIVVEVEVKGAVRLDHQVEAVPRPALHAHGLGQRDDRVMPGAVQVERALDIAAVVGDDAAGEAVGAIGRLVLLQLDDDLLLGAETSWASARGSGKPTATRAWN